MALPTGTDVSVKCVTKLPGDAKAVAVFVSADGPADAKAIGDAEVAHAVQRIWDAAKEPGKERKVGSTLIGSGKGLQRVLAVGLGEKAKITVHGIREAAGAVAKAVRGENVQKVAIVLPEVGLAAGDVARAVVEGFLLASFKYQEYRGKGNSNGNGKAIELSLVGKTDVSAAVLEGRIVAEAQNFARTIAFRPGNDINPVSLVKVVTAAAKEVGLKCRVLDEKQLAKLKMGGLLAVGGGATETPPRLIVLEHKPSKAKGGPVLLVGKTVTFDTGGISIKPADKMQRMIFDKCGGMAVLGTMVALARLKVQTHVVGILAAAENHISQKAYRPGDILRMYNGVTVEVTNTDAEGRLVLGDALAWGIEQYRPKLCVDLATLTGGVSVALGRSMAGIMGNDQKLVDDLIAVAKEQGEKMWQLPMPEEPGEMLKSDFADIVNSGGRDAHPLQGAAFLSYFVPQEGGKKVPWAHLDIAGVADTEKDLPLSGKGATGWGVRTMVSWLRRMSETF